MTWNTAQFSWPASIETIFSETVSPLETAKQQCDTHSDLLDNLSSLEIEKSETATGVSNSGSLILELDNLLNGVGYIGISHPWQHTVGQGEGHHRALSAPNALHNLSQSLKHSSIHLSNPIDCIGVLLTGNNVSSLLNQLRSFNAVFPIPELQFAERKAAQILDIENSKLVLPNQKAPTNLKPRAIKQTQTLKHIQQVTGNSLDNLSSMNLENTMPIDELNQVIEQKKILLEKRQSDYDNLKASLSGAEFFSYFTTGQDVIDIARNIEQSNYPTHEWTHSVAIVLIAPSGKLEVLKEVLGL